MREIKFRFWLGHNKKMTYPHELKDIGKIIPEFTDDIIPLQFTGLRDKNATEIYEGDIVNCNRYENGENYIVEIKDIRDIPRELYGSNLNYREVIGNIYENPEILKPNAKKSL